MRAPRRAPGRIGGAARRGARTARSGAALALAALALPTGGVAQAAGAAPPRACDPGLQVLVERAWAARADRAVGDTLLFTADPDAGACAAVVAGIFEPAPDPSRLTLERPRVLFHLPHLAALLGRPDAVDRFTMRLAPGTGAEPTASTLEARMPGTQVLPTAEVTGRASTTFLVIERFHGAIGLITLVAGGVFLACIMFLKVAERRQAVAALRLVGVSRRTLFVWIALEAGFVSLVGALLGVGLGLAASSIINAYYQAAYETSLVFSLVTPPAVLQSLGLAIGLGMLAGLIAAHHLLARDPLGELGR